MKQNTTPRKNKTKQVLNLPKTPYYTLEELFAINPQFNNINITMRVRHTKMVEDGKVAEIGNKTGAHGRPAKVYAQTPVTQLTLDKAEANKITLVDNAKNLVNFINVTPPYATNVTPSVNTPTSVKV